MNNHKTVKGVEWSEAFVGGFLMIIGSRLADGCTSGHGISGCAILLNASFLGTISMFATGIMCS